MALQCLDADDARRRNMADRVLRGSRLGTTSYETDRNTDLAPRHEVIYDCPNGHETRLPMASDAELPATWECRTCGATAQLRDGDAPEARAGKAPRTHWDMLLERRSLDDLEDVLNERLAELRPRPRKSA
jgi:rubredoxin